MSRLKRDESGLTFIEVAIAMAIFAIVIVSTDASISILNARSNDLSESSQGINQLQLAEQTLVTDLHSAQAFFTGSSCSTSYSFPSTGSTTTLSSPLYFRADLDGAQPCISVTLSSTTHTLTVTGANSNSTSASNLDSSASISVSCNDSDSSQTWYCTNASVNLKMDSPRVGASHVITTTMADPKVEIWEQEFTCVDTGGTSC